MNVASNLQAGQRRSLRVGDECYLSDDTDPGLFEDEDGNRYLILGGDEKQLIVLHHETLPRFTCLTIGSSMNLALGRWWGLPRLRLSHALRDTPSRSRFGIISVRDGYVELCVRSINGGINWLIVALVADPSLDCYFRGWILDATDVRFPFFKRKPNGKYSIGKLDSKPGFQAEIHAEIMNTQFVSFIVNN